MLVDFFLVFQRANGRIGRGSEAVRKKKKEWFRSRSVRSGAFSSPLHVLISLSSCSLRQSRDLFVRATRRKERMKGRKKTECGRGGILHFAAMVRSSNSPISDDLESHLEHDPDASLGHERRALRGTNGLGRATGGRERASVRGGRDGDRQANVDKACGGGIERARGARHHAGAGAGDIVVVRVVRV